MSLLRLAPFGGMATPALFDRTCKRFSLLMKLYVAGLMLFRSLKSTYKNASSPGEGVFDSDLIFSTASMDDYSERPAMNTLAPVPLKPSPFGLENVERLELVGKYRMKKD